MKTALFNKRSTGSILALGILMSSSQSFAMFPQHRYYRVIPGHFYVRNRQAWRHGQWFHGVYGGAHGWWWMVGSSWYFYEKPMYPYPALTATPVYYAEVPLYASPAPSQEIVVTPPAQQPQNAAPVAPQFAQTLPPTPPSQPAMQPAPLQR